jgi:hypothetical protein
MNWGKLFHAVSLHIQYHVLYMDLHKRFHIYSRIFKKGHTYTSYRPYFFRKLIAIQSLLR